MTRLDTVVIVPTYNERENITELVTQIMAQPVAGLGVIIVDDNSPDGTGEIADALAIQYRDRVHVVHRPGKLGLGTAYIAGFQKGFTFAPKRLMTMDADFSHNPRYIPDMVAKSAEYDLVIGSRYVPGGGAENCSLPRVLLSRGANLFAKIMLNLHAGDCTAGFRCYRREVLETIPLEQIFSSGYSFLVEMLFLTQRAGFRVGEVPIIFENRQLGASKISRQEIFKAQYTVVRLAARRVLAGDAQALAMLGLALGLLILTTAVITQRRNKT
ncbi:MAG: polyprenol monophosphomannose synthase [Anaerolineae bacterium]|nr:polyprenol monophosphomannose synthase [Anaerolineae bacterium]